MWVRRAALAALALGVLASASAANDETRKPPPQEPDPGFLEFLGSVDRLAELNPDYLAPVNAPAKPTTAKPAAPPPSQPPPANPPGAKNND